MKLRRLRQNRRASGAFENEFAIELLRSDKLRVTILICFFGIALPSILLLAVFAFEDFQRIFHGNFKSFLMIVLKVLGLGLCCFTLEWLAIDRRIKEQRKANPLLPYLSALVETSIPLAALLVTAQYVGPAYALLTPAPFMFPLLIVLSTLRLDFKLSVFTGAVAAVQYWFVSLVYIHQTGTVSSVEPILVSAPPHIFKGFLLLLTGIAAGLVTRQIKKRILNSFEMVEERNRISRTFGEYVSPIVMNRLLTLKPDLRSEKREVCVMFLDIRNFTSFAEKRSPEEVVSYLESLFEFMIEIVNRIGSSLRKEYTVIGDVVNLASRIEKLNKKFESRLLISENVWQSLEDDTKEAVPMGNVLVQGREKEIGIYQLA